MKCVDDVECNLDECDEVTKSRCWKYKKEKEALKSKNAIRNLHQAICENIDPDATIHTIKPNDIEKDGA